jgi:hypothetical protein
MPVYVFKLAAINSRQSQMKIIKQANYLQKENQYRGI